MDDLGSSETSCPGSNPTCLTQTKDTLNCLVLCPTTQSALQDLALILFLKQSIFFHI